MVEAWTIAFDCELRRPGCVLIQASFGATVPMNRFHHAFPPETWLLAPTPGMKVYPVNESVLEKLAVMATRAS